MAIPDKFAPQPTLPTGGLDRMMKIWESCRDVNDGGYGQCCVQSISGWFKAGTAKTTSCSPFTGTVIGMMFDPTGGEDSAKTYQPKCDNGTRALPVDFYSMHNGFYFALDKERKGSAAVAQARRDQFERNGWDWRHCDDSAISTVFFNLGYQIDPRDMRRGDLVSIDWANGHGHATFCWDVHLDDSGAVDCFQFLSANGGRNASGYFGAGVSVSTPKETVFFTHESGRYKKKFDLFVDNDKYIDQAWWYCLPKVSLRDVKLETFRDPTPPQKHVNDASFGGFSISSLRVVRFWGFPPPDSPHGTLLGNKADLARQRAKWPMPKSYATGHGTPPTGKIEKVSVIKQPKSHPDPIKATPPAPAQQTNAQVVSHQHFVESALAELHTAGWIDKSPGDATVISDAATKAAVEDFQVKFKVSPIDGIAGPVTRAALKHALVDLHAAKPNPNKPDRAPRLDVFYWLSNRVDVGGTNRLAVHGVHLDLVQMFEITLTEQASRRSVTLPVPLLVVNGAAVQSVPIPPAFGIGSILTASVKGKGSRGIVEKASQVPLYVGPLVKTAAGDWPWDESLWTPKMRAIVAELRKTPKGTGNYHRREITQYGVKEKILPGDTPVLDKNGRELGRCALKSLYSADIEGTMRLNGHILNIVKSGNVYDQIALRDIGGTIVKKPKPSLERFDATRSRWVDVSSYAPWGMGARMPLIPFRVLAHNPTSETPLYGRVVYIKQLDGLVMSTGEIHNGMCIVGDCGGMAPAGAQFDFFCGREDRHIAIPTLARSQGGSVCEVEILGVCTATGK
jgi:peptidoglycan hydrolase-like protein with peptidoglycan-binding domain